MQHRGRRNAFDLMTTVENRAPTGPNATPNQPQPPDHLSPAMQEWWRQVTAEHDLDPHRQHLLRLACEAFDRCQQAREALTREGISVAGKYGPRQHPAVAVERDAKSAFARLVRDLKLDPPPSPKVGGSGIGVTWEQLHKGR